MLITSKDNSTIKEIKKLKEKKYRKEKFLVEGIKMVKEAIQENADIELIVLREGTKIDFYNDANNDTDNYNEKNKLKFNIIEVSEKVFNELTDVVAPQGVLAVIKKKNNNQAEKNISELIDYNADYILALDGIQDPGNLGTILRTADSANLKQILVSKDTVDAFSPKVIRSTMGAIYRINVIEVENLVQVLEETKKKGFEVVTTDLQTDKSIYDINYNKKVVVIGNEANGVTKEVKEVADYKVKIPMLGKTESLNASVAAGIMIYEYVRTKLNK